MAPNLQTPRIDDYSPMEDPKWWAKQPIAPPGSPSSAPRTIPMLPGMSPLEGWATADPRKLGKTSDMYQVRNMVNGEWIESGKHTSIPYPMTKNKLGIFTIPDNQARIFVAALDSTE